MMDGYDMNGWGRFGMTIMVIVTVAVVGLFVWAIATRRASDHGYRRPADNSTRGSRVARSTRTNTANASRPSTGRTRARDASDEVGCVATR